MFSFMRPVVLAALLATFSCSPALVHAPIDITRNAAHRVELVNRTADFNCSSTAVGQHTLLTAAHCMPGTRHIIVDSETKQRTIVNAFFDDNDHALLIIDGAPFTSVLIIEQRRAVSGDRIFIWGWPGDAVEPVRRDGFYLRTEMTPVFGEMDVWQLPVYGGDSGSGMVSDKGTVITVVSLGNGSAETKTYPLAFNKDQLEAIR